MKKREIFDLWFRTKKQERITIICSYILDTHNIGDLSDKIPRFLQVFISSLCSKIENKYEKSHRKHARFLVSNTEWLDSELVLPDDFLNLLPSTSSTDVDMSSNLRPGRPVKPFSICNLKVKKRKIEDLLCTKSQEELTLAAEVSLRASGKRDAANIVREVSTSSPSRAIKMKQAVRKSDEPQTKMSPEQALSMMINAKLSTQQYITIRETNKNIGCNVYPPYYLVKNAKLDCYPPEEAITITEMSAEIQLQALLDLTIKRICLSQRIVFDQVTSTHLNLRLITKWGCDGSSAQSRYKQKLNDTEFSDEHLFSITLVPLRLVENNKIYWQNPRPNSTRYCRLLKFVYKKETKDLIKAETTKIKEQIANLLKTKLQISNCDITCEHELVFTMIDGKICSTLSQFDSSQKCYICGASPKQMNEVTVTDLLPNEDMYAFGISPLHSWIRSFECVLHISYKLDIKKWQARTPDEKNSVATRKANIQNQFRTEMGLLVDMPKQSAGNTNDGNTARRFFRNTEKSAEITGIDVDLIHHFRVLLEALSSNHEIDSTKFAAYAKQTKDIYLQHYAWYYMPASIHKILHHSEKIIQTCVLPLGQLSEEAQESSNKEYRRFREHFTRKTSRENTNRDVLNRFLMSSDPYLTNLNKTRPQKNHKLLQETIALFKDPAITSDDDSD